MIIFVILTICKCTIQWRLTHSQCCVTVTTISKTFSSSPTETLSPLNTNSLFVSLSPCYPPPYFLSLWMCLF